MRNSLLMILFLFAILACEKAERTNLFDPEVVLSTIKDFDYIIPEIGKIKLTWTDNYTEETGFNIGRKENDVWDFNFAVVDADIVEYIDNTVILENTYQYSISVVYGLNESEKQITITIDNIIPAPTNLEIIPNSITSCTLNWDDNSNGEDGFKIDRKKDDEEWIVSYSYVLENIETLTEADLVTGSTYQYRIYGYFGVNTSSSIETQVELIFISPTNLEIIQNNIHSFTLEWEDNSEGETGFKLGKKIGTNDWILEFAEVDENIESWTDEYAEVNEILKYRVYAFSGDDYSTSIETDEIDNALPLPENLSYTIIDTSSIELYWQYSIVGIDSFTIAKKIGENNWNNNYASISYDDLSWIDDGLESIVTYSYKIRANYDTYYSEYSNIVAVYTSHSRNIVINEVLYNPVGSDFNLEWIEIYNSSDKDFDVSGWKIESGGEDFYDVFTFPENSLIQSKQFILVGEADVNNCDYYSALSFQNGGVSTDGIRLVSHDSSYTDTILYDSPNTNNLSDDISTPGNFFAVNVQNGNSLARNEDGNDTNNCEFDFFECINPTPGEPNF